MAQVQSHQIIPSRYRKLIDMATTSRFNWLAVAVMVLAAVNLAFLAYIWLERKDKPEATQPHDARDYLVNELKLNESQQQQFDSLRKEHFGQVKADREQTRKLKDTFFGALKNGNADGDSSTAGEIGSLQAKIDLNTFRHFAALRRICTGQQKKRFDEIIEEVLRNMGRGPARPDGPPPGGRPGPPPPMH